jgi:hypothetical protein
MGGYMNGVNVKLTEFGIHGGCNGKEEPDASHPDDRGEGLCVFETRMLATCLGHEASLVA